jgi:hypothetical protein
VAGAQWNGTSGRARQAGVVASERWRVQAHWTVDGEARSYRPVFASTREEAERLAEEVSGTLRHFPTLAVSVELVGQDDADEECSPSPAVKPPIVHLLVDGSAACGTDLGVADAAVVEELWGETAVEGRCAICALTAST